MDEFDGGTSLLVGKDPLSLLATWVILQLAQQPIPPHPPPQVVGAKAVELGTLRLFLVSNMLVLSIGAQAGPSPPACGPDLWLC